MAATACPTLEKPALPERGHATVPFAVPPALHLTLLGSMRACDARGNEVLPRVRKTRAILAILALAAPEPVLRSHLIELLWSRRELKQAHGSLRQAVRELQIALGPAAALLRAERTHLALSSTGLRVDARQLASAGPAHPEPLALWQGTLLPDLVGLDPAFDRWLAGQSERLRQQARAAAEAILLEARGLGAIRAAAERLLAIDPAHEDAWRALIRIHTERGDKAAAMAAFEGCRSALFEHYQVAPSAETTALVSALRAAPALPEESAPVPDAAMMPLRRHLMRPQVRLGVAPLRAAATGGTAELAAALTEELIVALSRFRWAGCVAYPHGRAENDADFLLDGAVQRHDNRLRVLLRLTDLRAGDEVVWAERFDHDLGDIFALQDQLASRTAARLEPRLWLWQGSRLGVRDASPRTPQDLLHMAIPALYRLDRRSFMTAGQWLDRSVELDPDSAPAHAWAAQWHLFCVGQGWAEDAVGGMRRAQDLAERAVRLDPDDARGLALAGHVRGFLNHRPDEALLLHERAITANPNLPLSWCLSGLAHIYAGDYAAAIRQIRHAQMLSPHDPLTYFFEMGLAVPYLLEGAFATSVQVGRRAIALNRSFSSAYKTHLAALGHLGQAEAAAETRQALLALEPGFTVEEALRRSPIADPAARALYAEGLRLGGLS
jgi:DNA-binding SARP family transcriptional activator